MENDQIDAMSKLLKSMSHPIRLKILCLLQDQELSVGDIREEVKTTNANVSQHLNILKQASIIRSRRNGRQLLYRIANPLVMEAIHIMARVVRETCHSHVETMDLSDFDDSPVSGD